MVKSKSNKMHLEIKNDLELDVNDASISRRNRKSKEVSSLPIKRNKKPPKKTLKSKEDVVCNSNDPKMLAKK